MNDGFDELYLKVERRNRWWLIEQIELLCNEENGWRRQPNTEMRIPICGEGYHYICTATEDRPPALLAVYAKDEETLYVSTVVGLENTHPLSPERVGAGFV